MLIREMRPEDVGDVTRGERLVEETPWHRGDILDALREGWWCVVGEIDGEVVSWAIMRAVLDESELLTIGVMPDAQRRGIGEATLRALLDKMKDEHITQCFLEVRESNIRAQNLYRKCGFVKVGVRKDYYRLGEGRENAILMRYERGN